MDANGGSEVPIPFPLLLDNTLFESRQIFIYGEIDQKVAKDVSQKLIAMAEKSDDPIVIFINSQGGHVEAGDTIHDMIRFVKPSVKVVGTGWVASAGAHIYIAAERENRYALPNTRFMLHQPAGGIRGQAVDIGIEAREILKMRKRLNRVLAERTGQTLEKIEEDTDRNFWMSAEEALAYGLVGEIIESSDEL
ncbi:MAG: ATP-dependent Clp protease proteolytic subunit [Myxococcota bacterium]